MAYWWEFFCVCPIWWQQVLGHIYASSIIFCNNPGQESKLDVDKKTKRPRPPWICHALLEMGKAGPRKRGQFGNDKYIHKSIYAQRWSWGFQWPQWQSDISSLKGLGGGAGERSDFHLMGGWIMGNTTITRFKRSQRLQLPSSDAALQIRDFLPVPCLLLIFSGWLERNDILTIYCSSKHCANKRCWWELEPIIMQMTAE